MQDQSPQKPAHQHALRRGRFSQTNARYFVTFCTQPNTPHLTSPTTHEAFQATLNAMEADGTISQASYCLMPDHAHILFHLGERLPLAQAIARLKSKTKQLTPTQPLIWQSGYYDHKLRNAEDLHPILHYLYMNTYQAQVINTTETWPYTHIHETDWSWFAPLLNADCPYPEWLTDAFATKVAPT